MRRLVFVLPVVAVLAGAGGLSIVTDLWTESKQHSMRGRPVGAFLSGPWLLLIDDVRVRARASSAAGYRLAVLDGHDGKLLADRVFPVEQRCWRATEGRVWCSGRGALELLGLPKLETIATAAGLVSSRGQLAPDLYSASDGDVTVVLSNGKAARIDSETLAVSDADPTGITGAKQKKLGVSRDHDYPVDGGYLQFQGVPTGRLVLNPKSSGEVPVPDGAPLFLGRSSDLPRFIQPGAKGWVLVLHEASLSNGAPLMLSRLELEPRTITWTSNVGNAPVSAAALLDGSIVFATSNENLRAFALDASSGKLLWQFAFPP